MGNVSDVNALTQDQIRLRQASIEDIEALVSLLNRCYRSDEGWTHEADLIGGIRTTEDEIRRMILDNQIYLFVLPNPNDNTDILGCISVDFTPIEGQPAAYIGTFAVHPSLQRQGVGNIMLSAVETFVMRHSKADALSHFSMSILSHRPELLSYYQRRDYQLTGKKMPFPADGNNGEPKRQDLFLEFLQKPIVRS